MLCNIAGVPLKWEKTRGGFDCDYIGYRFCWSNLTGGIAEQRAAWLSNWCITTAKAGRVSIGDCKAAVGRFSFSAALLRNILPFLGPIYSWMAVLKDDRTYAIPAAIIIILQWLSEQVMKKYMVDLLYQRPRKLDKFFKADAKAEGEDVIIGGFEVSRPDGSLKDCRWFSIRITRQNCPWAYVRHDEAYRAISALELFATLLCVMLFNEESSTINRAVMILPGITDNRGNESLLVKHMTSKYPLYIVLLELVEQLQRRGLELDLKWQGRERNEAADALTNNEFDAFDMRKRIVPDMHRLAWSILPKLVVQANQLHQEISIAKKRLLNESRTVTVHKRRRKTEPLRTRDPW